MNRNLTTFAVGGALLALTLAGCGGSDGTSSTPSDAQISAALRSSAREMEPEARMEDAVPRFTGLLFRLRELPALAPLFDLYRVQDPMEMDDDDDAAGLIALLQAVKFTLDDGTLTITNRQTGGVIFTAPLSDLASGVFHPENLPGGTAPPPTSCTYAYSQWGACQAGGTQTRTVVSASPSGCTGTPILSQSCVYTPPVTTCSSFTYSAWGACQPTNTQTRTVLSSSPAGCTGGAPVLTQACVYSPPPDGAALYGQYCSRCHGTLASSNLKGRNISVSLIKSRNMTQGLNDTQLQAIVDAVGP
jgi:hypothetical protein